MSSRRPSDKQKLEDLSKSSNSTHQRHLFRYNIHQFIFFYKNVELHVKQHSNTLKNSWWLISGQETLGEAFRELDLEKQEAMLDFALFRDNCIASLKRLFDSYQDSVDRKYIPACSEIDRYKLKHFQSLKKIRDEVFHHLTFTNVERRIDTVFKVVKDLNDIAMAFLKYQDLVNSEYLQDNIINELEIDIQKRISEKTARRAKHQFFIATLLFTTNHTPPKFNEYYDYVNDKIFKR